MKLALVLSFSSCSEMVKRHRSASMEIELIQQNLLLLLPIALLFTHPGKKEEGKKKGKNPPLFSLQPPPSLFLLTIPSASPFPQPRQAPCPHPKKACKFRVHTFLLMIYCPGAEFHLLPLPFAEPVASQ